MPNIPKSNGYTNGTTAVHASQKDATAEQMASSAVEDYLVA